MSALPNFPAVAAALHAERASESATKGQSMNRDSFLYPLTTHYPQRADALIRWSEQAAKDRGLDSLPASAYASGCLMGHVRQLCHELDAFHGIGYRPPVGCVLSELDWLGQTWQVEVQRSDDGIEFGRMLVNGGWLEAEDIVHGEQLETWREELIYEGVLA
jgi:hypothetical protein